MNRLLALVCLLPLAACATAPHFNVHVNGLAGPQASELRDFTVAEAETADGAEALLHGEFVSHVVNAMRIEGWNYVPSPEDADIVLRVRAGISGPEQYEYTYQDPVIGQTGETTTYAVNTNPYLSYDATATTTPEYGVTHYETRTAIGTRFHRELELTAFACEGDGRSDRPVWETRIRSTGSSGDLRRVVPILLAAAGPHIGRSTGKELTISLKEADERVQRLVSPER